MGVGRSGRVEAVVDVPAEQVWRVASDPTQTGLWSHECLEVGWVGEVRRPVVGARFKGRNRNGSIRWARTCEIVSVDPGREIVWRTLPTPVLRDSTEWAISVDPVDGGTRIIQRFRVLQLPRVLDALFARVMPGHVDRSDALRADLERLAAVAASAPLNAAGS